MQITKPSILVVDDEANVRLTVQAILAHEGYHVDAASDGLEAIAAIGKRHYDLVLTDLKMPNVDGLAVLAEVQKQSPDTVTVVMTAYGSVDSATEAIQLGAYEYLLKPTEVSDLKLAVRRSLERKRLSEIDTLYSTGRALTRAHDFENVCTKVRDAVKRVLGLGNATLVALDRDGSGMVGGTPALHSLLASPLVINHLQDGGIITTEDENQPDLRRWAAAEGCESAVLVPGITGERLVCILCADGGTQPYDFHAAAQRFLLALAGQAAMAIENAMLISELRRNNNDLQQANQKLRELDKLKSQFLNIATHELRTPLSIIWGYNSMLAESAADRLTQSESQMLTQASGACKRLIRLVNSMLDVSQIEAGRMNMNFRPTDMREIIQNVVMLFTADATRKHIELRTKMPPRLPHAFVDPDRMEQVLVNLVANALKFTPEGGRITLAVSYHADSSEMNVSVSDSGTGIPPELCEKIFDEFTDAHVGRDGFGLGLSIAKRIVEAHGGRLVVRSAPGEGSTFTIAIPVKECRAVAQGGVGTAA